jgi:hypothetical protein
MIVGNAATGLRNDEIDGMAGQVPGFHGSRLAGLHKPGLFLNRSEPACDVEPGAKLISTPNHGGNVRVYAFKAFDRSRG